MRKHRKTREEIYGFWTKEARDAIDVAAKAKLMSREDFQAWREQLIARANPAKRHALGSALHHRKMRFLQAIYNPDEE